jgi:hypothetical protein
MISLCGISHAAGIKTSLEVIKQASETAYLVDDQGFVSKTIVDSDSENGEVTIELKVSNTKKDTETTEKLPTEIMLVIDNSPSMDFEVTAGQTRKNIVLNSAKQLVNAIFDKTSDVSIGMVDFHGVGSLLHGDAYASLHNATLRQGLTSDKATIIAALDEQLARETESGTNIDAGLKVAEQSFTKQPANKIIILLTDGIPNADATPTYLGHSTTDDVTTEKAIAIQDNTKQTIQDIKGKGIYVISMLTGINASDLQNDQNEVNTLEEQLAAVERIFGTASNPTADKYYLAKSADVNSIITNDIYNDVIKKISNPLSSTVMTDYFPDDILDNFEFSYVGTPSSGTVSDTIDKTTKSITWEIGTIKADEVVTLKYKLKIKDMQNTALLNKTIATNQKVVFNYVTIDQKAGILQLTTSPMIQLKEIQEEVVNNTTNTPAEDTTISNKIIPQTGIGIGLSVAIISVAGIVGFAYFKSNKFRNM